MNATAGRPYHMTNSVFRGACAFLLATSLLTLGRSLGAQKRPSTTPPKEDTTGVYPVGDAVHVYRAILDLLYVDGKDRPSVIVLWDKAEIGGGPCSGRCTESWPHQSAIDTATILAFMHKSHHRPRIVDFGYKIPIARVSDADFERWTHDGYGHLSQLPPKKNGPADAFWEGFRRKHPGAWNRVALGTVGFNPRRTEALIRVHQACGPSCQSSETVFLKRAGNEWRVIERVPDDTHARADSYGTFRYRGPVLAAGERTQIVAVDASGLPPRAESDDAAKIYSAILDRLYSPQGDRASQIVLAEAPAGPVWGVPAHRSRIDSSTIASFEALGQLHDQRYPRFGYRRPLTWMSEESRKQLDRIGVPAEEAHLQPGEEGMQPRFWDAFRSRYPGASGYRKLGRVAFNPAHTQALVLTQSFCGPTCISTDTWFLERKYEVWYVVERITQNHPGLYVPEPPAVYSGVYTSSFQENNFSPCDVRGIGSGWAVRFAHPPLAAFLQYQATQAGFPPVTHFVRVRGHVSAPGRFGIGFQAREIVVDSVLQILDAPQPCPSYEDLPHRWTAVAPSETRIVGAAVSENWSLAAAMDPEAIIKVWDVARRRLVQQFSALDTGRVDLNSGTPMAFTRDGRLLAAGGPDGVVRVWNPRDGRRIWNLVGTDTGQRTSASGQKMPARSEGLSFNDSGTLLANTLIGKTVFWSMTSGQRLGTHDYRTRFGFVFLRDSSFIAPGDGGLTGIYPRLDAPPVWSLPTQPQRISVMERSPDGRWLIVKGESSDTAHLWSLADGLPGASIVIPRSLTGAVAFSPDGNTLAMAGGGNGLYLWETKTGQPLRSFQKFPTHVRKAWFTPDGRSIVTHSDWDSTFRIVHLHPERNRTGVEKGNAEPVQAWWGSYLPPAGARQPPRSISGFVRDSSGNAIVGAQVSLYDGDRQRSTRIARVTTNAAGRYLVVHVAPSHVIIQVEKRGFVRETKYAHIPTNWLGVDITIGVAGQ